MGRQTPFGMPFARSLARANNQLRDLSEIVIIGNVHSGQAANAHRRDVGAASQHPLARMTRTVAARTGVTDKENP